MSRATIIAPHQAEWVLQSAVLIYGNRSADSSAYATIHPIETDGKAFRLGAGMPATKEASARFARALGAASTLSGFLPENLLYLGARTIVWWRRPGAATMYFDTTKKAAGDQQENRGSAGLIGKRAGKIMQPGLVFAVTPGRWFVYAVKSEDRPGPSSAIFRAPYFNVWKNGQVCTGNVRLPDTLSTAALDRYERAFFDSEFTHPNVRSGERLTLHPKGSYTFWREALDRGAGGSARAYGFDQRYLVDAKLTLEGLVKQLEKGHRDE